MAKDFNKTVDDYVGDGELPSSFQPREDGRFNLYTEAKLSSFINQASSQQNQFLSIQDAAQAA